MLKSFLRRNPVNGLTRVEMIPPPSFAEGASTKGNRARKQGKALETRLAADLARMTTSPILSQLWIRYSDKHGQQLACPDIVIPRELILIECKRTYTQEADAQLWLLYLPLVNRLWPGSWKLVVVCKYWAGPVKRLIPCPLDASVGINYCMWR